MTISTTTTTNRYTGNAVTVVFPYSFRILAATDLVVTKRLATTLVESTLAYPADYSVSGVGNATGGSITLTVAPATGDLLVIERNTSRTQSTSIRNQGSYFPETHENVFDKLTMLAQEDENALGRTFSLPKTLDPTLYEMELPVPVTGQALTWATNGLTHSAISPSSVTLPGQGRTTDTLSAYLANNYVYNVLDYDADPTGALDSSTAIAAADTAAVATGGLVVFPSGTYKVSVTTAIASPVQVLPGALLSPDTSKTLTLNGALVAGLYSFVGGAGTVLILNAAPYYPQWWGAKGDGVTDCTAAIQAALTAAGGSHSATVGAATSVATASGGVSDTGLDSLTGSVGGVVFLRRGKYKITGPLYVPANCVFAGAGRGSVLWHNGTGNAVQYARPSSTDGYSFGVRLQDFMVYGTNNGTSQHGIYIAYAQFGLLDNVVVENCGGNGVYINDHTVGMVLRNVRCRDNAISQLLFDGVPVGGSTYQNCDSHKVDGGLFHCNTRGQYAMRFRATEDIAIYHPQLDGSLTSTGFRLEGAIDTQIFGTFNEFHATHLSIDKDVTTGRRTQKTRIWSGDWEGGAGVSMNLAIDNADNTVIDGVHYFSPTAGASGTSIVTVGTNAVDTLIRGRCELLGLSDSGLNTRLDDYLTSSPNAQGVAGQKNANLCAQPNDLTAAGWTHGGSLTLTAGVTGPAGSGVTATRVASAAATNNTVFYQTADPSNGAYHCISFWARLASGPAYMSSNITVPGVGDELDQTVSLGSSFKRYVIQGALGVVVGNVGASFIVPNGTTVEIAGVKIEKGGSTGF